MAEELAQRLDNLEEELQRIKTRLDNCYRQLNSTINNRSRKVYKRIEDSKNKVFSRQAVIEEEVFNLSRDLNNLRLSRRINNPQSNYHFESTFHRYPVWGTSLSNRARMNPCDIWWHFLWKIRMHHSSMSSCVFFNNNALIWRAHNNGNCM